MNTRQAIRLISLTLALLTGSSACILSTLLPVPSPTSIDATEAAITLRGTSTSEAILTPSRGLTSTQPACLMTLGRVEEGALESTDPVQEFLTYLPPCYDEKRDQRYPVLYLLHGQTYRDDQWIRLGAVDAMDELIHSGESIPFIIVFPDDRYWNLPAGTSFGERLVDDLIPYIDSTYRTIPDRNGRAIGGMSRGAGWALRLGLTHWQLFGVIGLHSLAVFQQDASKIESWLADIPVPSRPRVFMDIGEDDPDLKMAQFVEAQFTKYELPHEWHLYGGAHTEKYWETHVDEYIRWYAEGWNNTPQR